jgi:hypothetical protein
VRSLWSLRPRRRGSKSVRGVGEVRDAAAVEVKSLKEIQDEEASVRLVEEMLREERELQEALRRSLEETSGAQRPRGRSKK